MHERLMHGQRKYSFRDEYTNEEINKYWSIGQMKRINRETEIEFYWIRTKILANYL